MLTPRLLWMWKLNHKERWSLRNWCFQIVVLEKTLQSPLGSKEIKPVNPKGNQPWIFLRRTDAEASILWPPNAKNWKTLKLGKIEGRRRRQHRMKWLGGIIHSVDTSLSKLQEIVKDREAWRLQSVHGVTKSWTWLSDWATTTKVFGLVTRRMELTLTGKGAVWWSKIWSSGLDIHTLILLLDIHVDVWISMRRDLSYRYKFDSANFLILIIILRLCTSMSSSLPKPGNGYWNI